MRELHPRENEGTIPDENEGTTPKKKENSQQRQNNNRIQVVTCLEIWIFQFGRKEAWEDLKDQSQEFCQEICMTGCCLCKGNSHARTMHKTDKRRQHNCVVPISTCVLEIEVVI